VRPGRRLLCSEPGRIAAGPLVGGAFAYLRDPDGLTLEIFQNATAAGQH